MVGLSRTGHSASLQIGSASPTTRLGIYGGTFDPVHIGHLILAQEALDQLKLDFILWVLTPNSPFKDPNRITDLMIRLDLLDKALKDNPRFQISFIDINRSPPHYAVDTLKILKTEYPNETLIYLMGSDSLADLPSWFEPNQIVSRVDGFGVMHRAGNQIDMVHLNLELPGLESKIHWIETPRLDISSTMIREKIRKRQAYRYYLHPKVYETIYEQNLYSEG